MGTPTESIYTLSDISNTKALRDGAEKNTEAKNMDDTDIKKAVGDILDLLADRFPDHVRDWANDRLQCDCPDPSGARDPRLDWA